MKKHLFLEGPIREGKSTLIRKLIEDHLTEIGGFSSQRLLSDSGETVGFRVVPASRAMDLTERYFPGMPDVFLYFYNGKSVVRPGAFVGSMVKYLEGSEEKKLILLDEIGGIELQLPEVRRALNRVLNGTVPCLGVLKLENSMRDMCRNPSVDNGSIGYHLHFRRNMAERFDTQILSFDRTCPEKTAAGVREFIDHIFV